MKTLFSRFRDFFVKGGGLILSVWYMFSKITEQERKKNHDNALAKGPEVEFSTLNTITFGPKWRHAKIETQYKDHPMNKCQTINVMLSSESSTIIVQNRFGLFRVFMREI